jgi:hypothetical protein
MFYALSEKKLSLLEGQYLINPVRDEIRAYITRGLENSIVADQWEYFNGMPARQFYEEFGSTINRMMSFLESPLIRSIIGQTENTLDFRRIMDEGYVLLVNLATSNRISQENAKLLGTLMINDIFLKAKGRPEGSRPFYLYIDECAQFINEDVARILDEGRKFGLHLILAHQHLNQLKNDAGDKVYHSVMTDAKTKVIFGGLDFESAKTLAEQVFLGEWDFEEPKAKFNKPVVVNYLRTWLKNRSESEVVSSNYSLAETSGRSTAETESEGENLIPGPLDDKSVMSTKSVGETIGTHTGETATTSWGTSRAASEGESEALVPELEWLPTIAYSYQEQLLKAIQTIHSQPTQNCVVKMPQKPSRVIRTETIKNPEPKEEKIAEFKTKNYEMLDYACRRPDVELLLENRRFLLEKNAREDGLQPEPESFRE